MNGQLSEHTLAELIREISEKNLSGSLRVERERRKVVVYLEDGRVVYAAGNLRSLRLAEYLKKSGLITEEQVAKYSTKRSDLALAAALTADGVVPLAAVNNVLKGLVVDVLRMAIFWRDGIWNFEGRTRLDDPIQLEIDVSDLLLEYARRMEPSFISSRFENVDELISPSNRPSLDGLLPTEGFLLSRVDNPIKLKDLIAVSGLPEADVMRNIYGLTLAGSLERERWPAAFRSAVVPAPKPTPVPVPVTPARTEEQDVPYFLERVEEAASYYEVLDIPPDAFAEHIKRAYYAIARKYHPDRFRGMAETPLHARLESSFARVTQAYETLMDVSRRRAYDAKVAAREKATNLARSAPKSASFGTISDSQNQSEGSSSELRQTEDIFMEGFAALQQGQINVALSLLAAAAREVPKEARYRAYYGQALATQERTRRTAESELLAALRLDPKNAGYRVMLAELYSDLGFSRRALNEAERALALEPGNAAARELVRKLR